TRQVDPRITGIAILAALILVQWFWWKGLVSKPKIPAAGGMANLSGMGVEPVAIGQEDVEVMTVSGEPEPGNTDGPGRDARFDGPSGLALDCTGNLIVADSRNHRIRLVELNGKTTTIAGSRSGHEDGPTSRAMFNSPS